MLRNSSGSDTSAAPAAPLSPEGRSSAHAATEETSPSSSKRRRSVQQVIESGGSAVGVPLFGVCIHICARAQLLHCSSLIIVKEAVILYSRPAAAVILSCDKQSPKCCQSAAPDISTLTDESGAYRCEYVTCTVRCSAVATAESFSYQEWHHGQCSSGSVSRTSSRKPLDTSATQAVVVAPCAADTYVYRHDSSEHQGGNV